MRQLFRGPNLNWHCETHKGELEKKGQVIRQPPPCLQTFFFFFVRRIILGTLAFSMALCVSLQRVETTMKLAASVWIDRFQKGSLFPLKSAQNTRDFSSN